MTGLIIIITFGRVVECLNIYLAGHLNQGVVYSNITFGRGSRYLNITFNTLGGGRGI